MLQVKRIYDKPDEGDGLRILVDRLWPRGLTKEKAKVDLWMKEISPSGQLRKWYKHDHKKWKEFKKRYFRDLINRDDVINFIIQKSKTSTVTILFSSKEKKYNNAFALLEYIKQKKSAKTA